MKKIKGEKIEHREDRQKNSEKIFVLDYPL